MNNLTFIDNIQFQLEDQANLLFQELLDLGKLKKDIENKIVDMENILLNNLNDYILKILELKIQKEPQNSTKYVLLKEKLQIFKSTFGQRLFIYKQSLSKELNFEEKLKKVYHAAVKLCHPDRVDPKFSQDATKAFYEIKKAYDLKDLNKI